MEEANQADQADQADQANQNQNDGKRAKKMFSDGFPIEDYSSPEFSGESEFNNKYKADEYYSSFAIDLALLTEEIINKAEINICIEDKVAITLLDTKQGYSNMPLPFDIDKLMDKLHGITKLNISALYENAVITRPPTTIVDFYNYDSLATVDLSQCTNLRSYTLAGDFDDDDNEYVDLPDLPDGVEYVAIVCNYLKDPSYISRLPASVIYFVMSCSFEDGINISSWPINLRYIYINYSNPNTVFSMLPLYLEELIIVNEELNTSIIFPPNLRYLNFYLDAEYQHILVIPDSVEILYMEYLSYPNLTTLPKNCKKFSYQSCPDEIMDGFKAKYPHVNLC